MPSSPEKGLELYSKEKEAADDFAKFEAMFDGREGEREPTPTEEELGEAAVEASIDYTAYTPEQAAKFHKELSGDLAGIHADIKSIEEAAAWGGLDEEAASTLEALKTKRDNYDGALRELAAIGNPKAEVAKLSTAESEVKPEASEVRDAEASHAKTIHAAVREDAGQEAHAIRVATGKATGVVANFAKKLVAKDEASTQEVTEAKQTHKDFVKQQEELWGKNDTIAPEDVPEGEMTYEQYLAQRPAAEDGDVYRVNGRFHDAKTGAFARESSTTKDAGSAAAGEYYRDKPEKQLTADRLRGESARDAIESEIIAKQNPKSESLLGLSNVINKLREQVAETDDEVAKAGLQSQLDAFLGTFDDLSGLYASDIDPRALKYAKDTLNEDPEARPAKGFVYAEGKKVEVTGFSELGGKKEYVISEDGHERQATADLLEFRQEELPETPEQAPKSWWKRAGEKLRTVMGGAYWASKWEVFKHDRRENLADIQDLERGVEDSMTEEEKEKKRRRNRIIKVAAISAISVAAVGGVIAGAIAISKGLSGGHEAALGAQDGLTGGLGLGEHKDWLQSHGVGAGSGVESVGGNTLEIGGVDTSTINVETISDAVPTTTIAPEAFTINGGEGGQAFFERLGIDGSKWYDNAQTLLDKFPQDFYRDGGDIRIAHTGPLSQAAQDFIKTLK